MLPDSTKSPPTTIPISKLMIPATTGSGNFFLGMVWTKELVQGGPLIIVVSLK